MTAMCALRAISSDVKLPSRISSANGRDGQVSGFARSCLPFQYQSAG